jgi:hypothetical protein
MIYWFSAYFNGGKPCYTKAETASAGCKMALSKLAVFSGWFSSTSGFVNFFAQVSRAQGLLDRCYYMYYWVDACAQGRQQCSNASCLLCAAHHGAAL